MMVAARPDFNCDRFFFRGLHPLISLGTASDRYAGWIGQIYAQERYDRQITKRTNRIGGKSFPEQVLPVSSVVEYFEHFSILEIDYTFYRPLLDETGKPTRTFHVLAGYRDYLAGEDFLFLKVPQFIFAQRLRRGKSYVQNPQFLDVQAFVEQFYRPAEELLGANLKGFIFEQEYQRRDTRIPVQDLAESLDKFFSALPRDSRYHIELRTEYYLREPLFRVLAKHGIGQVLSHWTWLPPLTKQFAKADQRFFNAANQQVVRLMTPMGMRYEEAYARAHPFDKLQTDMLQAGMIKDTAELMLTSVSRGAAINVIVNNRAGGNAPQIAQLISKEFMVRQEQGVSR